MSLVQIIAISAITGAFAIFAAVLAWGDYQTRHITSRIRADQQRASRLVALDHTAQAAKNKPEPHYEDDVVIPGF